MDIRTCFRFQFGKGEAIETVTKSRAALPIGLFLVLLTAIARNYDQNFFTETPMWLFGPLIFSAFSGTFLFTILYAFIRFRLESPSTVRTQEQWRRFMGLFWMTAPVAWLYAIPVERFMSLYHATQANLALFAAVSLWRVLLMSRVVSVLQRIGFVRALGWVLVPACLEVLFVLFIGALTSPAFGRRVMAGMMGMRNAPENDLLVSALNNVFVGALVLLPLVLAASCVRPLRGFAQPFPPLVKDRMPALGLLLLAVGWIGIAIPAQLEQFRFVTHARLIEDGKYRESVDYLSRFTRRDFPASRRIEPNPYEYQVFERLPKIMAVLRPADPEWVRSMYLEHLEVLFSHSVVSQNLSDLVAIFTALERLPEGKAWAQHNCPAYSNLIAVINPSGQPDPATQQLKDVLLRLGIDPEKSKIEMRYK